VQQEHGEVEAQGNDIRDAPTGDIFGRQEARCHKQCAQRAIQLAVEVPEFVR
jgi:hypothetical protein